MFKFTYRKSALLASTATLLATAVVGITPATAQDQDADEDAIVEEVLVTGSRIKRTNLDSVEPAIILGRELFEDRAVTNIADLLNETAAFGAPAASPIGGQNGFSVGQNIVDFLGLGSQRTLTLVNGRRYVSSNPPTAFGEAGGLQVDFNTIPVALVERIETIATGGAPTYGSDAIAGTINVILRDDFEGFEIQGRYGTSGDGDADQYQFQTTMGGNFADDRGNAVISVEYNRQQGLRVEDRPFFNINAPFTGLVDDPNNPGTDIARVFRDRRVQLVSFGGQLSPGSVTLPSLGVGSFDDGNFYQFAPSGDIVNYTPGAPGPGSAFFALGGDGPIFFDRTSQIQSPLERLVVSGFSHYDITDNITAFTEFTFANTEATELGNQAAFQTFAFAPGTSGALEIQADNPLLNAQAQGTLADLGVDSFYLSRINNDILNNGEDTSENFLWRVVGGFNGDFNIGDKNFYWDISANFGQSDIETRGRDIIDERFLNAIDAIKLTEADLQGLADEIEGTIADASDALVTRGGTANAGVGDVICRAVLEAELGIITSTSESGVIPDGTLPFIQGCVPLNLFGEGRASQAAIDFATGLTLSSSDLEQRVYTANLGGELIDLPAGPLSFAIGYENRAEEAVFTPSGFDALGLGRSSAIAGTSGAFSTNEYYAELLVPLLGEGAKYGMEFIDSLEFTPKIRQVENNIAGPATTYTLGGLLGLFDGQYKVRGNFTHSIRSPSLVELFSPVVNTFDFADDPCDDRFRNKGPAPATRQANCAAVGLGGPFTSNVVNATARGITGGNPDLGNETANSYTLGFVAEPDFVPGLALTVDYISIEMKNRITALSLEQQMQACFDSTDFPAVDVCNSFSRDSDGQVVTFSSGQANAALSELQAVTFDIAYNFEAVDFLNLFKSEDGNEDYGHVGLRVNGIRRIENAFSVVGEQATDNTGEFGQNKLQLTADAVYTYQDFRFFYRVIWQDSAINDVTDGVLVEREADGVLINKLGSRSIHNLSLTYSFLDGMTASVSVNNLWQRKGNVEQRARNHVTLRDETLGRYFSFTLKAGF